MPKWLVAFRLWACRNPWQWLGVQCMAFGANVGGAVYTLLRFYG